MDSGDNRLYYVYCIFKNTGVQSLSDTLPEGIDGNVCEVLARRELAAVICRLSESEYNEQALEVKMADVGWITGNASNHHEVISYVYEHSPVVPLPFCTIFSSLEKLNETINEQYEELMETLGFLATKESWDVKIFFREPLLKEKVTKDVSVSVNLEALSPGKQYLFKKRMAQIVNDKIEQEVEVFSRSLHSQVELLSEAVSIHKRWSEIQNGDELMAFNASYLVPAENVDNLHKKISEFREQKIESDEWRIVLSGSWPPYHFVKKDQRS